MYYVYISRVTERQSHGFPGHPSILEKTSARCECRAIGLGPIRAYGTQGIITNGGITGRRPGKSYMASRPARDIHNL